MTWAGGGLTRLLIVAAGALMTETNHAGSFTEALLAQGPVPAQAARMTLYTPLLGSWEVDVADYEEGGTRRTSKGEWHFAWVLEGRAIQDVFIAPARWARRPAQPATGNRYGTTLRVYDPKLDVWRLTWINPVSGVTNTLLGRQQGEEIVQEGQDTDGSLIRWSFSEITARSFRWRGELSTDEGRTWRLAAEFRGRRIGDRGAAR